MAGKKFTVLTDSPVCKNNDQLERSSSAEQIAELIQRSQENSPFTIGIDGAWGMGKSSLMLMVAEDLSNRGIITVWFNAWMHQHKENPAEGLVKTILLALHGGPNLYKLFGRRLGITFLKVLLHAAFGWLKVSNSVVDAIWRDFEQDVELANVFGEKLQKAIKKSTRGNGPIVVFIDDLDRCDPDVIIRLFEAVKVYLNVEGLVFVLGYDRSALINAVKNRLIKEHSQLAASYLEKIVQIRYRMTKPEENQIKSCLNNYLLNSHTEEVFTADLRPIITEGGRGNPRRMKQIVNTFALAHSLGLFSEEDLVFEARMWLLWMYYEPLYNIFAEDFDQILHFSEYSEMRLILDRGGMEAMDDELKSKLIKLVPKVEERPLSREELINELNGTAPAPFVDFHLDSSLRSVVKLLADTYKRRGPKGRKVMAEKARTQKQTLKKEQQLFKGSESYDINMELAAQKQLDLFTESFRLTIYKIINQLQYEPRPVELGATQVPGSNTWIIPEKTFSIYYQIDDERRLVKVLDIKVEQ